MCFIQLLSSRSGKSSRACAPRLSVRFFAESMVTTACAIKLSNSSVSIRSEFQISERSVTRTSDAAAKVSWISLWPSCSTSPVRNTAQLLCMTFCIFTRSSAVGVPPLALRSRSRRASAASAESFGSSGCLSFGVSVSARCSAAARPNTTRSISEFEPRRLAPCTDTQPASPSAISPGTTVSGSPFFLVSASPFQLVAMPPML